MLGLCLWPAYGLIARPPNFHVWHRLGPPSYSSERLRLGPRAWCLIRCASPQVRKHRMLLAGWLLDRSDPLVLGAASRRQVPLPRLAPGIRLLPVLCLGIFTPQMPASALATHAAITLLTWNSTGYCSTPLLSDPLSQHRQAQVAAMLQHASLPLAALQPLAAPLLQPATGAWCGACAWCFACFCSRARCHAKRTPGQLLLPAQHSPTHASACHCLCHCYRRRGSHDGGGVLGHHVLPAPAAGLAAAHADGRAQLAAAPAHAGSWQPGKGQPRVTAVAPERRRRSRGPPSVACAGRPLLACCACRDLLVPAVQHLAAVQGVGGAVSQWRIWWPCSLPSPVLHLACAMPGAQTPLSLLLLSVLVPAPLLAQVMQSLSTKWQVSPSLLIPCAINACMIFRFKLLGPVHWLAIPHPKGTATQQQQRDEPRLGPPWLRLAPRRGDNIKTGEGNGEGYQGERGD